MNELSWYVAHTRPRCEKKLKQYCEENGIEATVPCYGVAHKYRRKTVVFQKPLFPGYAFLRMQSADRRKVLESELVANLLHVYDQKTLEDQLSAILLALDTDLEIRLAPHIGEGMRVKILRGPLRGLEAWVEKRHGASMALLRLDFIGQAAAVKLEATDLEPA